jgi:hypothetical protein
MAMNIYHLSMQIAYRRQDEVGRIVIAEIPPHFEEATTGKLFRPSMNASGIHCRLFPEKNQGSQIWNKKLPAGLSSCSLFDRRLRLSSQSSFHGNPRVSAPRAIYLAVASFL